MFVHFCTEETSFGPAYSGYLPLAIVGEERGMKLDLSLTLCFEHAHVALPTA